MFLVRDIFGKRILLKLQDIKLIREYNKDNYVISAEMSKKDADKCKTQVELVYGDVLYLSTPMDDLLTIFGMGKDSQDQDDAEIINFSK